MGTDDLFLFSFVSVLFSCRLPSSLAIIVIGTGQNLLGLFSTGTEARFLFRFGLCFVSAATFFVNGNAPEHEQEWIATDWKGEKLVY